MIDVSIIIVNYNTCQLTKNCIDSIFEHTQGISFEIILVDNASTDGSKDVFEHDSRITYIYNNQNLGFGRANNLGNKYATGKYLFLLNSDTVLTGNSIIELYRFLEEHEGYASCGANLVNAEGENCSCHGNFPSLLNDFSAVGFNLFYRKYYRNKVVIVQKINEGDITNVDYVCGADIFIRKSVFDELGGFDSDYFMYYEETDLYYRMRKAGHRSCILSHISIIHLEGASTVKMSRRKFEMIFRSRTLFYKKNKSKFSLVLMKMLWVVAYLTRFYKYKGETWNRVSFVLKV